MYNKMKILHMTPPIVNNGIYRYIFNNWEYMDHNRFEFSFLMQAPEELMKTDEWKKYRFEIRYFSIPQRVDPDRFRKEIYNILSDGYDVIHLHTSYWRGFMIEEIAMELGIPRVIVHSHSSFIDQNDAIERERQLEIHNNLKSKFSSEYATDYWACSKVAADWLYGPNIPRERIKILPNAIDIDKFKYSEDTRIKLRRKYHLEDKLVLGCVGRFEYQKNQTFLIDILKKLQDKRHDAFLILIGEGDKENELRKKVHEYGLDDSILFAGWKNDVNNWLQAFDIFVLPSLFEGFPISLIEAQSSGLECIVSDTITRDSKINDNVYFYELDIDKWVEKISDYSTEIDRKMGSANVKLAGYDLVDAAKLLEDYYLNKC